jgi:hypothetical protein
MDLITRTEAQELRREGKISRNLFKALSRQFDHVEDPNCSIAQRARSMEGLRLATITLAVHRQPELWPEDEGFGK